MRKEDTVRLDTHALVERVEALALKQWWLARTVGVTTKTVGRWLNGRVKRIDRINAEKLAEALEIPLEAFTIADEGGEIMATREEQRLAAALLQEKELVTLLSPSDNWELAESLIRATMQPNLPLRQLGRLYNLLSITAWRQGRYEEGERLAERAREIGEQCEDRGIIHKATCNLATIHSFVGSMSASCAAFELCVSEPEQFDSPADHAAALSNLGAVYREIARFEPSRRRQREAIDLYASLDRPYNLAIAWTSLFALELELGRIDDAERALDRVDDYSSLVSYRRGVSQSRVYRGEIHARRGDAGSARRTIGRGLEELREHVVYDLTCHEIAARTYRMIGDMDAAETQIERGLAASEPFAWIHGMMLQEGARLRLTLGDTSGAQQMVAKADALMEGLGIRERVLGRFPSEYGSAIDTDIGLEAMVPGPVLIDGGAMKKILSM